MEQKHVFVRASELLPWWAWLLVVATVTILLEYLELWGGVFQPSLLEFLLVALFSTHVTIAGVTIYLHRYQAYRSLELHPAVSHFFRLWLWLNTGMVTKEWVAVHRKHHAKCETSEDPHSPKIYGIKRLVFAGVLLYVRASKDKEMLARYGKGTPEDWVERAIYTPYQKFGVVILLFADILLLGPLFGVLIWLVQIAWIPFWAAGVINGVGHYFGYRNYKSKNEIEDEEDWSRNIVPWGILIGGEELHNNHHNYPTSARLSAKRFEFDIGWLYIRIFETLGLAKVKFAYGRPLADGKYSHHEGS